MMTVILTSLTSRPWCVSLHLRLMFNACWRYTKLHCVLNLCTQGNLLPL
uniref:Uncharacterized protein n=1 Tax=Anguilla anguilla TaxID=7936 RepID=A0A0E9VLV5_ANGAN